jgi:hypothetical protein
MATTSALVIVLAWPEGSIFKRIFSFLVGFLVPFRSLPSIDLLLPSVSQIVAGLY